MNLEEELIVSVKQALRCEADIDRALARATDHYRRIAAVLVELRHSFCGPNGEPADLRGRSAGYRKAVQRAYQAAGVGNPVPKRLTVGVSYWVRKILVERYGRPYLTDVGILRGRLSIAERCTADWLDELPDDPNQCLLIVVGALNTLVIDPGVKPTEEIVQAAIRAVSLLRGRLRLPRSPAAAPDMSDRAFTSVSAGAGGFR